MRSLIIYEANLCSVSVWVDFREGYRSVSELVQLIERLPLLPSFPCKSMCGLWWKGPACNLGLGHCPHQSAKP